MKTVAMVKACWAMLREAEGRGGQSQVVKEEEEEETFTREMFHWEREKKQGRGEMRETARERARFFFTSQHVRDTFLE